MNKKIFVATTLSLVGGILNFLISLIRLPDSITPWFLTNLSGLVTVFAAIFLYLDFHNSRLWGGVIFLYSNLGFVSFGLSYERQLLPWGILTTILGMTGGALNISQK